METKKFAFSILDNIKMLFTGGVSVDQMMGPVGISEVVAKTNGFKEFVYMLALISLSLTLISGLLIKNKKVIINLLLDLISLGGIKLVYLIHDYIVNEYYSVWMLLLLVFLMIFLLLYLSYTLLKNIKNVVIRNKYVRKGGKDENKKRS